MRDGSAKMGRIQSENATDLVLVVDLVAGKLETIPTADVVTRTPSPVSAMPPGLVNTLTLEQILDLLAYLENDGDKDADAFK
jgi:putative heme-binding domain-containing protein